MRLNRLATFAASFLLCSAALAALDAPNPSMADLSGSFRINAEQQVGEDAKRQAAVDKANAVMGKEYKKYSKAIAKAAGAMAKLDKAFGDDALYNEQADFFVTLVATTAGVQSGNTANFALIDEIQKNPIKFSKIVQKNVKVGATINESDENSRINKAKTRKKKLKIISKATRHFERLIKRYGKNNENLG